MILPIYLYGSEKLRKENLEADLQDKEGLAKLLADMKETLKEADGCGLAAPQVGVNLRVVIVDGTDLSDTYDYLKDFRRVMINPVVLEESEETCEYSEGCLSVPEEYWLVKRPNVVKAKAQDRNGEWYEIEGEGLIARCICHECDHLDGHIYTEKAYHKLTDEEMDELFSAREEE